MKGFWTGFGKFVDGLVRPLVTGGLVGAVIYLAITGERDAMVAVIALASSAVTFWFKDRNADKAADVAAEVARAKVLSDAGAVNKDY